MVNPLLAFVSLSEDFSFSFSCTLPPPKIDINFKKSQQARFTKKSHRYVIPIYEPTITERLIRFLEVLSSNLNSTTFLVLEDSVSSTPLSCTNVDCWVVSLKFRWVSVKLIILAYEFAFKALLKLFTSK